MTPPPAPLEAISAGADEALWRRLLREGRAAYRIEARGAARRRTRLQSAKVLDAAGAFLSEATILDASVSGLRLLLARNCGVPARFGVHLDLSGEVATATVAWRRDLVIGARLLAQTPPTPLRASQRAALRNRYYAVPG